MKTGIESIDTILGNRGFPLSGKIVVTGNSLIYQTAILKHISKAMSKELPGIVISTRFATWTTQDVAQADLAIMETEDWASSVRLFAKARNADSFKLLVIDNVEEKGPIVTANTINKISERDGLFMVNLHGEGKGRFDIRLESDLTIKIEEKTMNNATNLSISIFGPYMTKKV